MAVSKKNLKPKPAKRKAKHDPNSRLLKKSSKEKSVSLKKEDTVTLPFKDARFLSSGTVTTFHGIIKQIEKDSCIINQDAANAPFHDKQETINHPMHYGGEHYAYEAIKVIEAWKLGFNLGNTVKYLSRAGKKGELIEDLKKAAWYLNREIENLEKEEN
jgi:hypothetical protein